MEIVIAILVGIISYIGLGVYLTKKGIEDYYFSIWNWGNFISLTIVVIMWVSFFVINQGFEFSIYDKNFLICTGASAIVYLGLLIYNIKSTSFWFGIFSTFYLTISVPILLIIIWLTTSALEDILRRKRY